MATAQSIITQALQIAGNTGLASADALNELNNFLDAEYRRKYRWQRKTVTISAASGAAANTTNWDTTYLGLYQQADGSVGRYNVPNTSPVQTTRMWALDYRQYIAKGDRLTSQGAPLNIVADPIGATWYVYPVPDQAYTLPVDIYYLPAAVALAGTPLWSTYAPDQILVQVVLCWALQWMDDERLDREQVRLYGDNKQRVPGMLPSYRRRQAAEEGVVLQTLLDQRVFAPMRGAWGGDDRAIWD